MWSTPSRTTAADGTEYNILVIDMEGMDNCSQVDQHVYLVLFLSSMLIYNQMPDIIQTSLCLLSYLTQMTDMTVGDATASEIEQFSPFFVWLIRDSMGLVEMSPNEYMESALKPVDATCESENLENKVRKSLQAVFANRRCFTLVRPASHLCDLWFRRKTSGFLTEYQRIV